MIWLKLQRQQEKNRKAWLKLNKELEHGAAAAGLIKNDILKLGSNFEALTKRLPLTAGALVGFAKAIVHPKAALGLLGAVILKVLSNTIEFALQVDKSAAAFRAATGAGYEYSKVISNAGSAYLTYGINATDAGNGYARS